MRLDISDLRLFSNVVEGGSLTQGAARSHRALASVSARIKEMEATVGAPLLIRHQQGVRLTAAGRALFQHSQVVLRDVQQMNEELAEYAKRLTGFVKVCTNTTGLLEVLPEPLAAFLSAYPAVNVNIEELINHEVAGSVTAGRADIGIVCQPADTRGLDSVPLQSSRYTLVVPAHDELARRHTVAFEELLDREFIGLGSGTRLHAALDECARGLGKTLLHRVQVRNFDLICQLVAGGLGLGIVPEPVAARLASRLPIRPIPLDDDWARLDFVICMRRRSDLAPHAARLVEFLERYGAEERRVANPPRLAVVS